MSSDELGKNDIIAMPIMERAETKKVTEVIKFDEEKILGRYFWVKFHLFLLRHFLALPVLRGMKYMKH